MAVRGEGGYRRDMQELMEKSQKFLLRPFTQKVKIYGKLHHSQAIAKGHRDEVIDGKLVTAQTMEDFVE